MADVKLRFQITDDGTVKVLDDVAGKTKNIGEEAEKSSERASRAFGALKTAAVATVAAVGAATAATITAVGRQFQQIDELAKVSRATGVAVRDLSGLQVAADLAGVSLQGLGTSLGIFSRRLVEAQAGVGKSGRIFEALGIDPRSGATTQQFLEQIADRFQELGTGAEATALSMELFGRSGARLINLLVEGGDSIRAAREQAELFGLVIEGDAAVAVERFNDNMSRLGSVATGAARELAVELAPAVAEVSDRIIEWVVANDELIDQRIDQWAEGAASAFSLLERAVTASVPPIVAAVDQISAALAAYDALPSWLKSAIENEGSSALRGGFGGLFSAVGSRLNDALFGDETVAPPAGFVGPPAPSSVAGASGNASDLVERIREAMGEVRRETTATKTETAQLADEFGRVNDLAKLVPIEVQGVTSEIEAAERAAVNLGDILSDSLISAVDSLIAGGDFDLGDVLESTGKAAMSRMVGAMLKEKLNFDSAFQANFLEFLPGVASQGADLIARNFGLGLQGVAAQASNAGQVVSGSLRGVGSAITLPPNAIAAGGGTITFVDDFGQRIVVPAGQAAAGSAISQGFTPGAGAAGAGAAGGGAAGFLATLGIGGSLALGQIAGGLAESGAFGSRAQNNADLFGYSVAAAALAPFTFGLAPLLVGLFGKRPPNRDQVTRIALGETFLDAGVFPGLFLAKEPPSEFRFFAPGQQDIYGPQEIDRLGDRARIERGIIQTPRVSPFGDRFGAEQSVIARLLGIDPERTGNNLGVFASGLGLTEEQYQARLAQVAQSMGSMDQVIQELNMQFLEFAVNGKGAAITQQGYNDAVAGTVRLFADELPAGVDAAAIAFQTMEQVGVTTVVTMKAFNEELQRQTQIASTLQSGVQGAGNAAVMATLRGEDPGSAFRSGLFSSVSSGVASQIVGTLFADGGPLGSALTEAILGEDPDALEAALSGAGGALEMLTAAADKFVPVLASLIDEVETGVQAADRSGFGSASASLRSRIDDARFRGMSPSQQRAFLDQQGNYGRLALQFALADGEVQDYEFDNFSAGAERLERSAFGRLAYAETLATGSTQQRLIRQSAFNDLEFLDSALQIAAETATMQDVQVVNMVVQNVTFNQNPAIG